MRRPILFASAVWIAVVASIAVSYLFWRIGYLRPHAAWALLSLASIAIPAAALVSTVAWCMFRGLNRLRAIGWLLVGITPLVGFGACFTDIRIRAETREPIGHLNAFRFISTWISSVMDVEARWRYSRWTYGKHAILLDEGQAPDADLLVSKMDEHIQSMAKLLRQPVPDYKFPWVKGSLVGLNGRAINLWAICNQDDSHSQLTYLDRHEVAHTLITALSGVNQNPPTLFEEGWAQSQSVNRDELIRALGEKHQNGRAYSLKELVESDWYIAGSGPVYWEGGPLVIYLLEHYGPEKFLELYAGVRRETFSADCHDILGDSWESIEKEFWPWLESEIERKENALEEEPVETKINLADAVSPKDWQEFVTLYRATEKSDSGVLPTNLSVAIDINRTATDEEHNLIDKLDQFEIRALFQKENLWVFDNLRFETNLFLQVSPEQCAHLSGSRLNSLHGWVKGKDLYSERVVRKMAKSAWDYWWELKYPGDWLPLTKDSELSGEYTITALTRPEGESNADWHLAFTTNSQVASDTHRIEYGLDCDPRFNFAITRFQYKYTKNENAPWTSIAESTYQRLSKLVLPLTMSSHSASDARNYVDVELHCRQLTEQEQQELRHRVQHAVTAWSNKNQENSKAMSPYYWLRRTLWIVAIGCPLVGVGLVVIPARPNHKAN